MKTLLGNGPKQTLKPVYYLIKHEEVLPHQKHNSPPVLAEYGTDQFSIRINDKGNDIVVKPLNSFSFTVSPLSNQIQNTHKKHNKSLHQQSLPLNDTDVTSDDEEYIYTRIPKIISPFSTDKTLHEQEETFSTIKKSTPNKIPKPLSESASAIDVQTNSNPITHYPQILPIYDPSFFKYKTYFQGFFLPDDYSLDLKTLPTQQSQDSILRTDHS